MLDLQQIERFHCEGYLVLRQVIFGTELDQLREAATRVVEEGVRRQGQRHRYVSNDQDAHWRDPTSSHQTGDQRTTYYYSSTHLWERHPIFKAVTANPDILAVVAQCMGHPFLPINDSMVCKLPGNEVVVPWHLDPPYEQNLSLRPDIPDFDVDIFLDACDKGTGTLWVLPGHHLEKSALSVGWDRDLFKDPDVVSLEMQPGDVLLHALTLPHASLANRGRDARRVVYLHYMAEENFLNSKRRWAGRTGGFGLDMIHAFFDMVAARDELGLPNDYQRHVRMTAEGLAPVVACTPPHYWRILRERAETPDRR